MLVCVWSLSAVELFQSGSGFNGASKSPPLFEYFWEVGREICWLLFELFVNFEVSSWIAVVTAAFVAFWTVGLETTAVATLSSINLEKKKKKELEDQEKKRNIRENRERTEEGFYSFKYEEIYQDGVSAIPDLIYR